MGKVAIQDNKGQSATLVRTHKSHRPTAKKVTRRQRKENIKGSVLRLPLYNLCVRGTTPWWTSTNDPVAPRKIKIMDNAAADRVEAPEIPLHDVSSAEEEERIPAKYWHYRQQQQTPFNVGGSVNTVNNFTPGLLMAIENGPAFSMIESPPPLASGKQICQYGFPNIVQVTPTTTRPSAVVTRNSAMPDSSLKGVEEFEKMCRAKWTNVRESSLLSDDKASTMLKVHQRPPTPFPLLTGTPSEIRAKKCPELQLPRCTINRLSFQERLNNLKETAEPYNAPLEISSSDCDENIASVLTSPQKIEITAETSVDVDETDILAVVEALVITTCRLSHPCLQKVSLESVYNRVFKIENRIKKQIVVFL
ncbi:uncharacterized protein LOC111264687 isoform X2 [Varroa jacobsoni]|uniref:uncharacterized protein LOC111264687 isoform X2 n=1 Tax=Varroa jacobsoni TaxID=62625 RepID=UPI000BF6C0F8|nr:uncharacterized protein LOC111264687 isoform X2 [Varroa jacobsoni]